MKKNKCLNFILIIISVFFFISIEVFAATKDELSKYTNITLDEGSSVCVYSYTPNNTSDRSVTIYEEELDSMFDYIVIKFEKKDELGEKAYQLSDLTLEIDGQPYQNRYRTFALIGHENKEYVDGNICGNYKIYVDHSLDWKSLYFYVYPNNNRDYDYYYSYDAEATSKVESSMKKTNSGSEVSVCKIKDTDIELGTYITVNGNIGYFETTNKNKSKICPAEVKNKQNYIRIPIDLNNFECEKWKIVENKEILDMEHADCHYYLVDKDSETYVEGTQTEISGDYVTRYVAYNHSSAKSIRIIKNKDGTFKAVVKEGDKEKEIKISNMSNDKFQTAFKSGNKEGYPIYILSSDNNYQFSNEKGSGSSSNVTSYINIEKINTIGGLGEEIIIKDCEDLFGNTFLDFLNNNVVKVIYIGIPILLILLTSLDFAKVVFIDDKEGIQGAAKKFGKRAVIAVLIFLIPSILSFVMNIFVAEEVSKCVEEFKNVAEDSNS